MNYIVWQKAEYEDAWRRTDCGDEPALQRTILEMLKQPGEVEVTVPISYQVKVSLSKVPADIVPAPAPLYAGKGKQAKEEVTVEATESRPPEDKGTKR